jgi:hypothetical protein
MADPEQSFAITRDSGDSGVYPTDAKEGDAKGVKQGIVAFAAVDNSDNLAYIKLTADGSVPVSGDGAGTSKHARGKAALNNSTYTTLANITGLTASKLHRGICVKVTCRHGADFEVVLIDDVGGTPVETNITDLMTDPGSPNDTFTCDKLEFTTGATGTIDLLVRAKSFTGGTPDARATIVTAEIG